MQKKFCLSFSEVVEEILQGCYGEKNLGKSFFVKLLTTLKVHLQLSACFFVQLILQGK